MKAKLNKYLPLLSSVAMSAALFSFGTTCRFWLYEPPAPAKLLAMDK